MLFVSPRYHRRGIASALVATTLHELHREGFKTLESSYYLGNEASRAWHRNFGFEEEPDLLLARLYHAQVRHELWRREKIGGLTQEEREQLLCQTEYSKLEVARLERIAHEQGFEAVSPILRRYDRMRPAN